MNKFSKLFSATMMSAVLVSGNALAEEVNLLLGHTAPTSSVFEQSAQIFADKVSELSGGEVSVDVVGGGALGGIPELWAQTRSGALDLHLFDVGGVNFMTEGKDFTVLFAPYLFEDQAHYHRYLESATFERMMGKVEDGTGITYLGYVGDRPPRAVSTRNAPVIVPADLEGVKVRIAMSPSIVATYEAFGAVPTPIPPSELLVALRTGVVDGQDQGLADYLDAGYDQANPYYAPINNVHTGMGLWISENGMAKLSDEQKTWVNEAVAYTGEVQNAAMEQRLIDAITTAQERGVQISEPDMDAFKAATVPAVEKLDGVNWTEGLYNEINGL